MLTAKKKQNIIKKVQKHDTDTGSSEAQVAILSEKIIYLTNHLKTHKKDLHSRRGLVKMVDDRRKHIKYLKKVDEKAYLELVEKLALKK